MTAGTCFPKGISGKFVLLAVCIYIKLQAVRKMWIVRRSSAGLPDKIYGHNLLFFPLSFSQQQVHKAQHIGASEGNAPCPGGMLYQRIIPVSKAPPAPAQGFGNSGLKKSLKFHPFNVPQHDGSNMDGGRSIGV